MRVEHIGSATLYHADSIQIIDGLSWNTMVTDPPNGGSLISDNIGPRVVAKAIEKRWNGIVFPGTKEWRKYPDPTEIGAILIDDAPVQPVFYYGLINYFGRQGHSFSYVSNSFDEVKDIRHVAAKPLGWMNWAVAKTQGTVIDPFMGSGTTGIACVQQKRPFIGIEVVDEYFELACERIEKATQSLSARLTPA